MFTTQERLAATPLLTQKATQIASEWYAPGPVTSITLETILIIVQIIVAIVKAWQWLFGPEKAAKVLRNPGLIARTMIYRAVRKGVPHQFEVDNVYKSMLAILARTSAEEVAQVYAEVNAMKGE